MVNAQEWLDKKYPNKLKVTEISTPLFKELEGELKIEGFPKLEKLVCSKNQLTNLIVANCPNLVKIDCSDNLLTKFELVTENPKKLVSLNITNNNFPQQDLSYFTQFINLQKLYLGTTSQEKMEKGVYNRFYGSLELLQNLTNLKELGISNTDIDSGVDFLPKGLQRIHCAGQRKNAGCQQIQAKFQNIFGKLADYYNLTNNKDDTASIRTFSSGSSLTSTAQLITKEKIRSSYFAHEPATNEINEITNWENELEQLKSQLTELNNIVCPQTKLNFTNLKTEIKKLKINELTLRLQTKKVQLEKLITTSQNKAGEDLKVIINLFHQTQQQIIEHKQENNNFAHSQLITYQNALQGKVSKEELLELTRLQKEVFQIEEQLTSLGWQQIQIQDISSSIVQN